MMNRMNSRLNNNSLILIYNDFKDTSLNFRKETEYSLISMIGDYLPSPPHVENINTSYYESLKLALNKNIIKRTDVGSSISANPKTLITVKRGVDEEDVRKGEEKAKEVQEILFGNSNKDAESRVLKLVEDSSREVMQKLLAPLLKMGIGKLMGSFPSPIIVHDIPVETGRIDTEKLNSLLKSMERIKKYTDAFHKYLALKNKEDILSGGPNKHLDIRNIIKDIDKMPRTHRILRVDTDSMSGAFRSIGDKLYELAESIPQDLRDIYLENKLPQVEKLDNMLKEQEEDSYVTEIILTDKKGREKEGFDLYLNTEDNLVGSLSSIFSKENKSEESKKDINHFLLSRMKIKRLLYDSYPLKDALNFIPMDNDNLNSFSKIHKELSKYFSNGRDKSGLIHEQQEAVHMEVDGVEGRPNQQVRLKKKKKSSHSSLRYIREIVNSSPKNITKFSETFLK